MIPEGIRGGVGVDENESGGGDPGVVVGVDRALLPGALNDTWKWVEKDLTLVTVPEADHWVQQDAAELVTRTMVGWLRR